MQLEKLLKCTHDREKIVANINAVMMGGGGGIIQLSPLVSLIMYYLPYITILKGQHLKDGYSTTYMINGL